MSHGRDCIGIIYDLPLLRRPDCEALESRTKVLSCGVSVCVARAGEKSMSWWMEDLIGVVCGLVFAAVVAWIFLAMAG